MRDLLTLSQFALRLPGCPANVSRAGAFDIPSPSTGATLRVIASAAAGWDHVSVSTKRRCPNWPEMSRIKELFFHDDECAMQLGVPRSDHINNHAFCLHWWRPHGVEIPRPPIELIGVPGMTHDENKALSFEQRLAIRERAADQIAAREAARG